MISSNDHHCGIYGKNKDSKGKKKRIEVSYEWWKTRKGSVSFHHHQIISSSTQSTRTIFRWASLASWRLEKPKTKHLLGNPEKTDWVWWCLGLHFDDNLRRS